MTRIQMLGLCRFSYLGGAGFQIRHETMEERRAFLYQPERLARRWFWFESVALPGLIAQTDPDFTLVVMTGPDLPEPYLGMLRDLAATVPQIRLELVEPMEAHLDACMTAIAPHVEQGADVVGHFRHDDDDAVSVDYIAAARADFPLVEPAFSRSRRGYIDYPRGLVLHAEDDRLRIEPRMIHNAVAGLTVFLAPDLPRSAVHYAHWKLALSMPGLVLGSQPRFVRVLHGDNDSGAVGASYPWKLGPAEAEALLADRFKVDLAGLRQGLGRLSDQKEAEEQDPSAR